MGPGFVPPSHCRTPSRTVNGLIRPGKRAPSGAPGVAGPAPFWAMLIVLLAASVGGLLARYRKAGT